MRRDPELRQARITQIDQDLAAPAELTGAARQVYFFPEVEPEPELCFLAAA